MRAVVRALAIFDAFDPEHTSLSLQEISKRIGIPKATTFRLVNTMSRAGFLVRLSDQRYCLSAKLARLGSMVRSTLSIRDVVRPVMAEVNQFAHETITLNVVSNDERVCLEVVDTPSPLMTIVKPGERVPLLYGATGRILLANMDEVQLSQVLSRADSQLDTVSLERELRRFRSQGYALTRGQRIQGITSIAVPIRAPHMTEQYCLALTGPSVRVDVKEFEFVELMLAAGQKIAGLLGSQPQSDTQESFDSVEAKPARKGRGRKVQPQEVDQTT